MDWIFAAAIMAAPLLKHFKEKWNPVSAGAATVNFDRPLFRPRGCATT
jgi:hypothetical protein